MNAVVLDGSLGEGGGQILRSSLALSALTGRPLVLDRIRAGRAKPGLARQHLTCVCAAAEVVGAETSGAELRSQSLRFVPAHAPRAGTYHFDIGTAGSTGLVFQTVLWPLALADGDSEVVITGGTHNPMSPPYDFLVTSFLPILRRVGIDVDLTLERHGFYPAGGGRIRAHIRGSHGAMPSALRLLDRGAARPPRARILLADLPAHIATREARELERSLGIDATSVEVEELSGSGPGNAVIIELGHEALTEVVTSFGEKRVRAELVAARAAAEAETYLRASAPVGEHLADQLVIPLALAGGGEIACTEPSEHTRTNIEVVQSFVNTRFEIDRDDASYRLRAIDG